MSHNATAGATKGRSSKGYSPRLRTLMLEEEIFEAFRATTLIVGVGFGAFLFEAFGLIACVGLPLPVLACRIIVVCLYAR